MPPKDLFLVYLPKTLILCSQETYCRYICIHIFIQHLSYYQDSCRVCLNHSLPHPEKMALSVDMQVLCINCNDCIFLTDIPLIPIGFGGINKGECNDLENELQHIPNMKSLDGFNFRWAYRKLVSFTKYDVGEERWNGDYLMYMCVDERSQLPHNDILEDLMSLKREPGIPTHSFKVYGDAFVFRMESRLRGSDERWPAKYLHMDEGFIDSLATRRPVGPWAFYVLRSLLICPNEEA